MGPKTPRSTVLTAEEEAIVIPSAGTRRDAAEVLHLRQEALDQVALAVEAFAEAGFPAPVALGRDVGRGALVLDQLAGSPMEPERKLPDRGFLVCRECFPHRSEIRAC